MLLVGGAGFGFPAVSGLAPDVDLDGDGLESFVIDGDGRIVSCVDGDRSILSGRDCWIDPRMADGFAYVFHISALGAAFAGRYPDWELWHPEGCPGCPPDPSLFDPL